MQKWQEQPGAAWPSGPGEGTLARAASTTSEGLCQGAPAALSCRHSARPPHCRKVTSPDEELNTILRHPSALDLTNEILCVTL